MSYKLVPTGNVFTLHCGDIPCSCPIKESFPQRIAAPAPKIETANPAERSLDKIVFLNQGCKSDCPLFEIEGVDVILHCGNGRTIHNVEQIKN